MVKDSGFCINIERHMGSSEHVPNSNNTAGLVTRGTKECISIKSNLLLLSLKESSTNRFKGATFNKGPILFIEAQLLNPNH